MKKTKSFMAFFSIFNVKGSWCSLECRYSNTVAVENIARRLIEVFAVQVCTEKLPLA